MAFAVIWSAQARSKAHRVDVSTLTFAGSFLSFFLLASSCLFNSSTCIAAELPTVSQLRQAHAALSDASSSVEGKIEVYRAESANEAALVQMPTELGMSLIRSGYLWRSSEMFRADFSSYDNIGDTAKEDLHSFALDGEKAYELSGGDLDIGMLRVCDLGTPEADLIVKNIGHDFYRPLDALWSGGDVRFIDYLQRPGSEIAPSKSSMLPGGVSLFAPGDGGSEGGIRFEFESSANYPFGYYSTSGEGEAGDARIRVQRRVFSLERGGQLYPSRTVDVVSFGAEGGYTEVVMLSLKPLEENSPIAKALTAASFENFGSSYQVYNIRSGEQEEIAERFDGASTAPSAGMPENMFRTYFLWINGVGIFAVLTYVAYTRIKKRRKR